MISGSPIAAFVRLHTVARMISDADLMEHASVVGWGFLISLLAGVALYLYVGFTGGVGMGKSIHAGVVVVADGRLCLSNQ